MTIRIVNLVSYQRGRAFIVNTQSNSHLIDLTPPLNQNNFVFSNAQVGNERPEGRMRPVAFIFATCDCFPNESPYIFLNLYIIVIALPQHTYTLKKIITSLSTLCERSFPKALAIFSSIGDFIRSMCRCKSAWLNKQSRQNQFSDIYGNFEKVYN